MLDNLPEPVVPKAESRISVSKDQAASLKIGLSVRLEVVGEIKELSRDFNDKEKYNVVLEDPVVKNVTPDEGEEKDDGKETLATLSKEEFKKLISKKD